jgi:hypothetical protein
MAIGASSSSLVNNATRNGGSNGGSNGSRTPLSVEDLLAKQKAEKEAASKVRRR